MTKRREYTPQERIALILHEIEAQDQAWTEFMMNLTTEQTFEPADGSWSAMEVLIHTVSWIENAVRIAHFRQILTSLTLAHTRDLQVISTFTWIASMP